MRVAVFGGSFNPPTIAHMEMIFVLLGDPHIDKIIVAPAGQREDKWLESGIHRLEMIRMAVLEYFGEPISNLDRNRPDPLGTGCNILLDDHDISVTGKMQPTADKIRMFQAMFPHAQIAWVIGSDLLPSIHTWKEFQGFLRHQKFIVIRRAGFPEIEGQNPLLQVRFLEANVRQVSSTRGRSFIQEWRSLRDTNPQKALTCLNGIHQVFPRAVFQYIQEKGLYGTQIYGISLKPNSQPTGGSRSNKLVEGYIEKLL